MKLSPEQLQRVIDMRIEWTKPGTFYDLNGGRFKGHNRMTKEQELEYVAQTVIDRANTTLEKL